MFCIGLYYKLYTVGSAKIYPRPKIKKTPPTKIGPFSNSYVWGKIMVKFWGYVSLPILEILAFKGPNLALMAKYITRGVESQKRPLFQSVLGTEHEYYLKIPNFDSLESNLAVLDLNWAQIGPKLAPNWPKKAKNAFIGPESQTKPFFHTIWKVYHDSLLEIPKSWFLRSTLAPETVEKGSKIY